MSNHEHDKMAYCTHEDCLKHYPSLDQFRLPTDSLGFDVQRRDAWCNINHTLIERYNPMMNR